MAFTKKSRQLFYFFLFLLFLTTTFIWWRISNQPVNSKKTAQKIIVIKKGQSIDQIAQNLKENNFIRSVLAFKLKIYQLGLIKKIQAGDYRLSSSMSLTQIIQSLSHGTIDQWVTIPEGWRAEEIIEFFEKNFFSTPLSQTDKTPFLQKEGYLFPDTYLIPKKSTAQNIIAIFQKNFDQKFNSQLEKEAKKNNLTKNDVVILASLVEREAKNPEDRPLIAGILLKRLQKNWPLQVDATLQYIVASQQCKITQDKCHWWPQPKSGDKRIRSPYNTYQNPGFPPAPICNPGLSSIKATIYPKTSDYWYYLSDKNGQIYYSTTLEEHQKNIKEFLNEE
jgi:UPF0755 protein